MNRAAAMFGFFLLGLSDASAQALPVHPNLNTVFPMGGKAGTTLEVTVAGTDLDEPTGLHFADKNFKAELIVPPEPKPDPKQKDPPKPKPKPLPTSHKFKLTIPADALLGHHDVRIVTKLGLSGPRTFVVGDRAEVNETDKPNDDTDQAQVLALNSVVNGTIAANADVDYFRFAGDASQRVILSCQTSTIDSRCRPLLELFDLSGKRIASNRNYRDNDALIDAVLPAKGEYVVRLCEFAYQSGGADHFYRLTIGTGPWIDCTVPSVVSPSKPTEVTLYGRNLPGGKPTGRKDSDGTLLEALNVTVTPPKDAPRDRLLVRDLVAPPEALLDGFEFRLPGSNPVRFSYSDAAIRIESKDNGAPDKAEAIAVPCDVIGLIEKRYDKDWFQFAAKKGDSYVIELFADRLGSNMDAYFVVKNAAGLGNVFEEQDDDQDSLHPTQFFNRSGDPAAAKFVAPADGNYVVLVGSRSTNVQFGPRCQYRLRIAKPVPDFRAIAMPKTRENASAVHLDAGGTAAIDVFVDRRDGFADAVNLAVAGLPPGVSAKPAFVGTNGRWGTIVLVATKEAAAFTGPLIVTCTSTAGDKPLSHVARPASITWSVQPNSNIPTVARLDEELLLAVRERKSMLAVAVDLAGAKVKSKDKDGKDVEAKLAGPIVVKPGDKLTLPVKIEWTGAEARANPVNLRMERIHPSNQQASIGTIGNDENNPAAMIAKEKGDGTITIDVRPTAAPGRHPLVVRAETQIAFVRNPAMKDQKANAIVQAFAEPLEVTVLPLALGKFSSTAPDGNKLKPGSKGDISIKVERLHGYSGTFAVKATLPKEAVGVSIADATFPANVDEFRLPIAIAADAKDVGNFTVDLAIVATVQEKYPIVHTSKVNGLRVVVEKPKK